MPVKIFRVAMLALIAALLIQKGGQLQPGLTRPPLLPLFVVCFIALTIVASPGWIPTGLWDWLAQLSRWLLMVAIAAAGMKTNLKQVLSVGGVAITLLAIETVYLAGFMLSGILILR